jgi:hypothetical protein
LQLISCHYVLSLFMLYVLCVISYNQEQGRLDAFWGLRQNIEMGPIFFFLKVTIFFFFFKVKYTLALLGQIMLSFQFDLKNFHYSLCEIQSVFLFIFSLFFFKYLILIFCLLLTTNLFKALFERWRLDSDSWAFCIAPLWRRRGRKEEKKRKSSSVVVCGALFGMGFVRFFFIYYFFFPEFVYGLSHMENDPLHFKIPLIPPFSAFWKVMHLMQYHH